MHEDMLVAGLEEDNNNQYYGNKSDTVGVNQPIQKNEPTNTTINTPSTSCCSALLHYASRSVRCLCLPYYVDRYMFVLHCSLVITVFASTGNDVWLFIFSPKCSIFILVYHNGIFRLRKLMAGSLYIFCHMCLWKLLESFCVVLSILNVFSALQVQRASD